MLNLTEKITYGILAVAMIAGTIWAFFYPGIYEVFVREDNVAEYATAILFGIMAIMSIGRMLKHFRSGKKLAGLTWLGLFLMTFFVFGEEISWGQRIFNVQRGDFFKELNTQDETNLHNLKFNGVSLNRLIFSKIVTIAMGIYFLLLPLLANKINWIRNFLINWRVPIPQNHHIITLLICTFIIMIIPVPKNWELWEMAFAFIFFLVLYKPRQLT